MGLKDRHDGSIAELDALNRLADALSTSADEDVRLLFHKQFAKFGSDQQELETEIKAYHQARAAASADYERSLEKIPLDEIDYNWRQAVATYWPISWFSKRKITRLLQSYADFGTSNPATDIVAIAAMRQHKSAIDTSLLNGQSQHFKGHQTDNVAIVQQLAKAAELRKSLMAASRLFGEPKSISQAIHPHINGQAGESLLFCAAKEFQTAWQDFRSKLHRFGTLVSGDPIEDNTVNSLSTLKQIATQIQLRRAHLQRWTGWCEERQQADQAGLSACCRSLVSGEITSDKVVDRFRLGYARWWIKGIVDRDEVLRTFQRFRREDAIRDFGELDDQARETAAAHAKQKVAHRLPKPEGVPRCSELGLLRHQVGLTRPSKSIREVISSMPDSFGKLAPCLLMSPLSIAQYLPVDHALFDVVIFHEASQITTWDAVGAIARGRQTIIVGDPRQLPPTNFFGRSNDDETNDDIKDHEKYLESILDEAKASGLPTLQLNWHYRSRHESMIAFSN